MLNKPLNDKNVAVHARFAQRVIVAAAGVSMSEVKVFGKPLNNAQMAILHAVRSA